MTMIRQINEEVVNERMKDPLWRDVIVEAMMNLNEGKYPTRYVDVIGQKWRNSSSYDLYDTLPFLAVHTAIRTGLIAIFQVPVHETPYRDKMATANNATLSKITGPFKAKFWGGTQGEDGYIEWSKPVNAILDTGAECGYVIALPKIYFPLEVGTTSFVKTKFQLTYAFMDSGPCCGLARWPYGQNRITVLVPSKLTHGVGDDNFPELRKQVYGDFGTLPNPWNDEWKLSI